jgi:hypothetical protein
MLVRLRLVGLVGFWVTSIRRRVMCARRTHHAVRGVQKQTVRHAATHETVTVILGEGAEVFRLQTSTMPSDGVPPSRPSNKKSSPPMREALRINRSRDSSDQKASAPIDSEGRQQQQQASNARAE